MGLEFKKHSFGSFTNFVLDEKIMLKNGDKETSVKYHFYKNAINRYKHPNFDQYLNRETSIETYTQNEVLNHFFTSPEYNRFNNALITSFDKIARWYRGFPSALYKTEKLIVHFTNTKEIQISCDPEEVKEIKIEFGVVMLYMNKKEIESILTHELYHVIAAFHHKEKEQSEKLNHYESKLHKKVVKNKNKLFSWMKEMQTHFSDDFYSKNIKVLKEFYQDTERIFWNHVIDTGLSIVAMELEDDAYVKQFLKFQKRFNDEFANLISGFNNERKMINHTLKNDDVRRNFILNMINIMEYIAGFTSMPFYVLPFANIGDKWHPQNIFFEKFKSQKYDRTARKYVSIFEYIINENYEDVTKKRFLKFWNSYKEMTNDMNIWINPTKPNYKKDVIHNVKSQKSALETYKILHLEFKKLFDNIVEYEKKLIKN